MPGRACVSAAWAGPGRGSLVAAGGSRLWELASHGSPSPSSRAHVLPINPALLMGAESPPEKASEDKFDLVILTGNPAQKPGQICRKLVIRAQNERVNLGRTRVTAWEAAARGGCSASAWQASGMKLHLQSDLQAGAAPARCPPGVGLRDEGGPQSTWRSALPGSGSGQGPEGIGTAHPQRPPQSWNIHPSALWLRADGVGGPG